MKALPSNRVSRLGYKLKPNAVLKKFLLLVILKLVKNPNKDLKLDIK